MKAETKIKRLLTCPELTAEEIQKITEAVFAKPKVDEADVLFVFGSSYGEWGEVAELYKGGWVRTVYVAGGAKGKSKKPLARMIRDSLIDWDVPEEAILTNERSQNTLEDATFGKELFVAKRIPHERILFAAKAPHSGRCLRTLQKVFPDSKLYPFIYSFRYRGRIVTSTIANTWWQDQLARAYVYGEYQRIKLYSSRGDIA